MLGKHATSPWIQLLKMLSSGGRRSGAYLIIDKIYMALPFFHVVRVGKVQASVKAGRGSFWQSPSIVTDTGIKQHSHAVVAERQVPPPGMASSLLLDG